jgi:hypothetical protein
MSTAVLRKIGRSDAQLLKNPDAIGALAIWLCASREVRKVKAVS